MSTVLLINEVVCEEAGLSECLCGGVYVDACVVGLTRDIPQYWKHSTTVDLHSLTLFLLGLVLRVTLQVFGHL